MYIAQGRGDATLWLFQNLFEIDELTWRDWFGSGLRNFYSISYNEFDKLDYGLAYMGAATGAFQSYITLGYAGLITKFLFFFSMIFQIKNKRIRYVILAVVIWEYFLYTGLIFREILFSLLLIFFVHYANYLYNIVLLNKKNNISDNTLMSFFR